METELIEPQTEDKIQSWILFACQANGVSSLAAQINYKFRARFTRILGQAYAQARLIEFSKPLWARANEAQRKQVVIHEACHIIAYHKYGFGIKAHGLEWKRCMVAAQAKPVRCHDVNRDGLKRQYVKYEAACSCSTTWIGHVKAAKVKKNKFSCKKCKQIVKLTGQTFRPIAA